jgi:prepilin-type N-terminal cleavage/methylation domain-containing protein
MGRRRQAFSMTELMVVVVVMSVLTFAMTTVANNQATRLRFDRCWTSFQVVSDALSRASLSVAEIGEVNSGVPLGQAFEDPAMRHEIELCLDRALSDVLDPWGYPMRLATDYTPASGRGIFYLYAEGSTIMTLPGFNHAVTVSVRIGPESKPMYVRALTKGTD